MGWAQRLGNLVGVMDLFMFSHSVSAGLWACWVYLGRGFNGWALGDCFPGAGPSFLSYWHQYHLKLPS